MKQITMIFFSFLLVFIFLETAEGQTTVFSDDFEDGSITDWSNNQDWSASDSSSINSSRSLKHALSDVEGNSYITNSISADDINSKVTTWQFNIKNGSWDPSGGNYFGIAILGDEANPQSGTFNGYVVGINFTGTSDLLTLYKVTDGSYSEIITTDYDWDSGNLIGVEIERNSTGIWQLFYDIDGDFDNLISGGSTTDTDHTTFSDFSVYFEYSKTRAGELWVDDIRIEQADETVKVEPSDHVADFSVSGSIKSVNVSWSDVTNSPTPDGYLIKANHTGFALISDPEDATPESDDSDLSDGSATLNVLQGIEEASFSGLNEETTYYFKIYPYTNTGNDIDYKTDGTVPESQTTTLETPPIVLNEFLADPGGNDINGDGAVSSDDDEFIEFVNTGNSDLDVSDWKIEDEIGTRYTFPDNTILKPNQGIVIFGGGVPTGDFGGSIVKTTSSLSLNNSGDSIILKNDSGLEILTHTYSSSSAGASETRSPDLTGSFTDHSSAFNGTSFSPGTSVDGFAFHPRVEITGNEGWRILSSPTSNSTYKEFLDPIWTQCSDNSNYNGNLCDTDSETQPNVQVYNGSDFEGVNDLNTNMNRGEGFIVYVYADDDFDGSADAFPKTLELFESVSSDDVNATLTSGPDNWTLVGNPYNSPISWENLNLSSLNGTVYVYDHSYGNVTGEDVEDPNVGGGYRTWNSNGIGSLTSGIIAPFQGFWVQNSDSNPSLTFTESAQTTGGTFYTKENDNVISLCLRSEIENMFSETFLSFTESGQLGHDKNDGLKLSPLDFRDYMSLSTEVEGTQLDINNLPSELYNPVEIPLHVQAFEAVESGWTLMGGEVTLSWPGMNNIPSEWKITLTDTKLNRTVDLKSANQYVFEAEGNRAKIQGKEPFSPFNPKPFQKEKAVSDARFLIIINPNVPDGLIDDDIPDQFTLEQNYPNPFNPTTNIKFEIAETSNVSLNVYNVMGQRVATLVNEVKAPGTYEIAWDARDMASGIYYYRLRADGVVFNRQMTLIK